MVTSRRHRIDRAFTEFVLHRVKPGDRLLRRKSIVRQKSERALQHRQRFPAVRPLDDDLAGNPTLSALAAYLNEDTVTKELLQASFLDTEQTAHLISRQQGYISTAHDRNTTPSRRRTDARTSNDLPKTPIESNK